MLWSEGVGLFSSEEEPLVEDAKGDLGLFITWTFQDGGHTSPKFS